MVSSVVLWSTWKINRLVLSKKICHRIEAAGVGSLVYDVQQILDKL